MENDLQKAIQLLTAGHHTCVLCRGDKFYISDERGVAPLLGFLAAGTDLRGFSAADKVIGKATAMLYCLLGVSQVYAPVMSKAATQILLDHGIRPLFDTQVSGILNRTKTGPCPMEFAVRQITDLSEGYQAILRTRQQLQSPEKLTK